MTVVNYVAFAFIICAALLDGAVLSADTRDQRDKVARIVLSMRQSTLIQSMTHAACFAMGGVDTARSRDAALAQLNTFETVLSGLREGHEWLGLKPEDSPDSLEQIEIAEISWQAYRPAIEQIVAQDYHATIMQQILSTSAHTVESANSLARHFLSAHGDDVFDTSMAGALFLASHHRMLSQRAMKELCLVQFSLGGHEMHDRLRRTISEFEHAFAALSNGAGGVPAPPNSRIERNYRTAKLFWEKMRPIFNAVLEGDRPSDTDLAKVLKLNASVLKQLNQAVEGYLIRS